MTHIFSATDDTISQAAVLIRAGRLVAFPTETVYGLGANVYNAKAVASIFEAKGRRIVYNDAKGLREEYIEDLNNPPESPEKTDKESINQDVEKYDIYKSLERGSTVFANIIVEPKKVEEIKCPESIPVPRYALRRLSKEHGEKLMRLYQLPI